MQTKYSPRWLIFLTDLIITGLSLMLAYLLRFNFEIPAYDLETLSWVFPSVLLIRAVTFISFKTYAGIVRYTGTADAVRIFMVGLLGSGLLTVANLVKFWWVDDYFVVPFSVLIIEFFTTTFALIALRIAVKVMYLEWKKPDGSKTRAAVVGNSDTLRAFKRALDREQDNEIEVRAFLDPILNTSGKKLEGIPFIKRAQLDQIINKGELDSIVFADDVMSKQDKRSLIDQCLAGDLQVLNVPPLDKWINGDKGLGQLQQIKIDDLLGRDAIELDEAHINDYINGRIVLITGAAGSIGSEVVRQVLRFGPKRVIALDQAESPLYELELEIRQKNTSAVFEIVIADVRNMERMQHVFDTFKPELVFHAAAYKHVPLMEENPAEAIRTNVLGSKILADLSVASGVDRFIMISTDKAVNPTNVMGASKRCAEIYVQALQTKSKTCFITTRFGNVLGSNGSVIPLFKKQISHGGPVTVTHPEVTRYFMTIPEACQLVLQAGSLGSGGEIFVFDMGESVKIIDLAKKMIQLAGLKLGKDIQIEFSGLRPGEKLYEELLSDEENTLPTPHPQIMIAKVRQQEWQLIQQNIQEIIKAYDAQDEKNMVRLMKALIPEYISRNSNFSNLDVA